MVWIVGEVYMHELRISLIQSRQLHKSNQFIELKI